MESRISPSTTRRRLRTKTADPSSLRSVPQSDTMWYKKTTLDDVLQESGPTINLPARTELAWANTQLMVEHRKMLMDSAAETEAFEDIQRAATTAARAAGAPAQLMRQAAAQAAQTGGGQPSGAGLSSGGGGAGGAIAAQLQAMTASMAEAQSRAEAAHASQLAEIMAHSAKQVAQQENAIQLMRDSLQNVPEIPQAPIPAVTPTRQIVENHYHQHVAEPEAETRRNAALGVLHEGQQQASRAIGQLIETMQSQGASVQHIIEQLGTQPRHALTQIAQIANIDARSVTQALQFVQNTQNIDARTVNVDARQANLFKQANLFQQTNMFHRPPGVLSIEDADRNPKRKPDPIAASSSSGSNDRPPPPPGAGAIALRAAEPATKKKPTLVFNNPLPHLPPPPPPPPPAGALAVKSPERFYIGDDDATSSAEKRRKQTERVTSFVHELAKQLGKHRAGGQNFGGVGHRLDEPQRGSNTGVRQTIVKNRARPPRLVRA